MFKKDERVIDLIFFFLISIDSLSNVRNIFTDWKSLYNSTLNVENVNFHF